MRRKWFGAAAVLSWATLGLLWAQVILLPNPLLPPPLFAELLGDVPSSTHPQRFIVMLFKETSLILTAFALFGLFMATLAHRAGARKSSLVAAGLCAATVAVSLMPVAQAWKDASAEGVSLSLPGYFAGPAFAADRSPETVTYARPGGEELEADVWRPPGGGPAGEADAAKGRPAVIVVHGGGWRSGERGDFPRWNAWLASKGYVVFDIDYRLSPPPSWRDAPADVRCAVGWVKENAARYGVDPERVALMGRSAGGHLALLTAYTQGSAPTPGCDARNLQDTGVAAAVAFYPPTDLARLSSLGYLGGMDRFIGGTRDAVPERYRLLSPVLRVDPRAPPTFLAHGGDDQIVPPAQSELLADRLREAGVPHRLVELPWANHTFDFLWGGWGSQITRSTLQEFLEVHLETPSVTQDDPSRPVPEG
ncbi:MAG: alpha/beta hydrolase [Actinomycetota bacterium]|nr:alpha/beta hydrolase [Actinomycetota bacterium]